MTDKTERISEDILTTMTDKRILFVHIDIFNTLY